MLRAGAPWTGWTGAQNGGKMTPKLPEIVAWQETVENGAVIGLIGLIIKPLDHAHYITVNKDGSWALWHFGSNDNRVIVKRGSAQNVNDAKAMSTMQAFGTLKPLKRMLKEQKDAKDEKSGVSKGKRTAAFLIRGFVSTSLTLLTIAYAFVHHTNYALILLGFLGISFGIFVKVFAWFERLSIRREKLAAQELSKALGMGKR